MATPHINAQLDEFAETVLMPGDPLRAKYLAENYLESAKLVTNVRNMLGYTGYYQDKKISVMGSGMGIPSISIYAWELFNHYNVNQIIRIGSCGAVQKRVDVYDIVVAQTAATDSNINAQRFGNMHFAPYADYHLMENVVATARRADVSLHIGSVFSADSFYNNDEQHIEQLRRAGILAAEMEAAGLYGIATQCQKRALAVNTVSDHLLTGHSLSSIEREQTFDRMIEIVLQSCLLD